MNIVQFSRLLKKSALLLSLLGSGFLLAACGGGDSKKSNSSSSSSSTSSSSAHSFSSTPVTEPGSGTWPDVKVSASGTKALRFDWTAAPGATFYKLLKKADANSSFVQVGSDFTTTTVSDTVSVHLTDWVNSRYKVQACDASGCTDSSPIVIDSAMRNAITYIKASNAEKDDWFGWSLAMSGDGKTMAVGAPNESSNAVGVNGDQTSNTSPTSGAVYVFIKVNGNWVQEAYLKASNTEQPSETEPPLPNSRFGYQVAISADGNTLAVSAINEDSRSFQINCAPNYKTASQAASNSSGFISIRADFNIGAVYVFKREAGNWAQTTYLKPSIFLYAQTSPFSPQHDQMFGSSLALSGDGKTLAVSVVPESNYVGGVFNLIDTSSASSASSCFNFNPSSTSSTSSSSSSSSLSSSSTSSTASSGSSASSSVPGGTNSGAVYLFKQVNGSWVEDAFVKAADAGPGDEFAISVSLSEDGNTLAVGARGEDSKDTTATNASVTVSSWSQELDAGAVYLFQRADGLWSQKAKIKPSVNEWSQFFGTSVALSGDGNTLAVGTPGDWGKSSGTKGDPTNYTLELEKLINYSAQTYYLSPKSDASYASGATYIFRKSGDTWSQEAYLKASNPLPGYGFGSALSISRDGNVLAVGCWIESSQASGINGDQQDTSSAYSGAAYSFVRTGTSWTQSAYIKAPVNGANDRFAHALGLDALGETLVIGAHREASKAKGINGDKTDRAKTADEAGYASGAVYIY